MASAAQNRASRERNGYLSERARGRAVARSAAWVRREYPQVWKKLLTEALAELHAEKPSTNP